MRWLADVIAELWEADFVINLLFLPFEGQWAIVSATSLNCRGAKPPDPHL